MQLKIHFEQDISRSLYNDYCRFLFDRVKDEIRDLINPKKYKVREKYIIESKIMKWTRKPTSINLSDYVADCLELSRVKGEYVIRMNSRKVVRSSRTKVETLVRLLEYGNEFLPAYPVVRRVIRKYSRIYPYLLVEFMRERMIR